MTSEPKVNNIGLGARIADFLHEQYSDNRAKRIANDFKVSAGSAKRWLRGISPTTAIIEEMAGRWGIAFVTVAFADYIAAKDAEALKVVELMETDARKKAAKRERDKISREKRRSAPRPVQDPQVEHSIDGNRPGMFELCVEDEEIPATKKARPVPTWAKALRGFLERL